MIEENKLSRFFITTTFKGQSLQEVIFTSPKKYVINGDTIIRKKDSNGVS